MFSVSMPKFSCGSRYLNLSLECLILSVYRSVTHNVYDISTFCHNNMKTKGQTTKGVNCNNNGDNRQFIIEGYDSFTGNGNMDVDIIVKYPALHLRPLLSSRWLS